MVECCHWLQCADFDALPLRLRMSLNKERDLIRLGVHTKAMFESNLWFMLLECEGFKFQEHNISVECGHFVTYW